MVIFHLRDGFFSIFEITKLQRMNGERKIWIGPVIFMILLFNACFQETSKNISKVKLPQEIAQLDKGFFKPVYNPNAQSILLTDQSDKGLSMFDLETKTLTKLTESVITDQNILFSPDGTHVFFVEQNFANRKKESTLVVLETSSKTKKNAVSGVRKIKLLQATDSYLVFLQDDELRKYDTETGESSSCTDDRKYIYLDDELTLVFWQNGEKHILNPGGDGRYLWVSVSPDQQKILYHIAGQGAYICDHEGKEIIELGRLRAVKWSPDGKWLVGMEDLDDGKKFTQSNLFLISADGKIKRNLTQHSNIISLYPSFSADSKKVIFNDENGKVYQIDIF